MSETDLGREMFLGWTPDRQRVYVTIRLEIRTGEFQTTEHQTVDTAERLSFTGEIYRGRSGFSDRQVVEAGQVRHAVREVLAGRLAPGVSAEDVATIARAWKLWHLNGMQAACAHVAPVGDSTHDRLGNTPVCPESDYRYGSAWLYRPLPTGLVGTLRDACSRIPGKSLA